jgi:hypothetical protein
LGRLCAIAADRSDLSSSGLGLVARRSRGDFGRAGYLAALRFLFPSAVEEEEPLSLGASGVLGACGRLLLPW